MLDGGGDGILEGSLTPEFSVLEELEEDDDEELSALCRVAELEFPFIMGAQKKWDAQSTEKQKTPRKKNIG